MVFVSVRPLMMTTYHKQKGLALGLTSLGFTVSGIASPLLLHCLREMYGFQMSLLLFGAALANMTPLAYLLRLLLMPNTLTSGTKRSVPGPTRAALLPQEDGSRPKSKTLPERLILGFSWFRDLYEISRLPAFHVIVVSLALMLIVGFVFSKTMLDYGLDKGISLSDVIWLTTYCTLSSVPGFVVLPFFADRGWIRPTSLLLACLIIVGGAYMALPHVVTYWAVAANCMMLSFCGSCCFVIHDILMADTVGIERVALIYGFAGVVKWPLELCCPALIREYAGNSVQIFFNF